MESAAAALGLVAGVGSVITIVGKTITTLNTARIKFSESDLSIELLVGQLYTVRTALTQVEAFVSESPLFDENNEKFATDLCVAVEHCKLLVQHIHNQIDRLDWSPGETLSSQSKARLLLEERILRDDMMLLNNQISALNLCLTAYRCRPNLSAKDVFEHELAQYRERQVADDTASAKVAADLMSFPPPQALYTSSRATSRTNIIKRFDLDRMSLKTNFYEYGLRSLGRSSSLGTVDPHESQQQPMVTLKSSILRLSNSVAQSARLDTLIKRDATQRNRQVKLITFGQRPAAVIKRLRFALASSPHPEEIECGRRTIVPSTLKSLLSLAEYAGQTVALFHILQRQDDIRLLESFVEAGGPLWEVSPEICKAAMSLWSSPRIQDCFKKMDQDLLSTYFLRATERILRPDYEPTPTDIIKADQDQKGSATEAKLTVDDVSVEIIDAPQPKLQRFMQHFDDADALLITLDLSSYDQYSEGSTLSALELALRSVKHRCRKSWHGEKPAMIIMYNTAIFRRKVTTSPVSHHLSDCDRQRPIKNFQESKDLILQRCRGVVPAEQPLFYHYSEDDAEDLLIVDFFKKSVLELPHLITCIKNLNHLMGTTPKRRYHDTDNVQQVRTSGSSTRSTSLPII